MVDWRKEILKESTSLTKRRARRRYDRKSIGLINSRNANSPRNLAAKTDKGD